MYRKTLRRLDGSLPGNTRALRTLFARRCGSTGKPTKVVNPWRRPTFFQRLQGPARTPHRQTTPVPPPDEVDWSAPCSFVFREEFRNIGTEYSIFFRFILGCVTPRSVDGKAAWTTRKSVTRLSSEVLVTYKTQESARVIEEFVPISSLELCVPGVRDLALVVKGEDTGKVVFAARIARNDAKARIGMYCKLSKDAKGKKSEKLYLNDSITRISPFSEVSATS